MEQRKPGTLERHPQIFAQLESFGVPAAVWVEINEEVFHPAPNALAQPLQDLIFELEIGRRMSGEFPRAKGSSDHEYVRSILQAIAEDFASKGSVNAQLMDDEGWSEPDENGMRMKPLKGVVH